MGAPRQAGNVDHRRHDHHRLHSSFGDPQVLEGGRPRNDGWNIRVFQRKRSSQFRQRWGTILIRSVPDTWVTDYS